MTMLNGFQFVERMTNQLTSALAEFFSKQISSKKLKVESLDVISTDEYDPFKLLYGISEHETAKPYTLSQKLIETQRPTLKFEALPHNFCNHRRSQLNSKYRTTTFIIQDRSDYVSRQTYRPLIEEQYKRLLNITTLLNNNFMFIIGNKLILPW